jgi:phosphocarrier protein
MFSYRSIEQNAGGDLTPTARGRCPGRPVSGNGAHEEVAVAERRVTVGSRIGLHARPAAIFVQAAAKQPVKVTLGKEGKPSVDARSILSVLGMDIRGGEEVILTADGDGADKALDELAALVARDLDAPDA